MTIKSIGIVVTALIVIDAVVWSTIISDQRQKKLELFFFDVGQGDSEMIRMPGNVKLLIDGGPDNQKALARIDDIAAWGDRYIDMVMVSHMELDHFGGLLDVIDRYDVGVFLYNGRLAETESAKQLMILLKKKGVPIVKLNENDCISYKDNKIIIESGQAIGTKKNNANETALVARFIGGGIQALFTGDIGKATEAKLVANGIGPIDILKVPHHGSKFSSTKEFLEAIHPKAAIIEVGKNSYGHPTKEVLERLREAKIAVFRTDRDGMVYLVVEDGKIRKNNGK